MKYTTLREVEYRGAGEAFALHIEVAATKLPDLKTDAIQQAAYEAERLVAGEVRAAIKADDANTPVEIARNRELVGLFPEPIFVEEIQNGYCSDWCCRHLPWFVVTTTAGRFTIGWRKRVIKIDWSGTRGTKTAKILFPNENVTKGERYIHAWSMEDAQRYISTVLNSGG